MTQPEIKDLTMRRAVIKSQLTHFNTYLNKYQENPDPVKLQVKLDRLKEYFAGFNDIQTRLEQLQGKEVQAERFNIEDTYLDLLTTAEKTMTRNRHEEITSGTQDLTASPATIISNTGGVRLPKVNLPTFDGAMENWLAFKDQFKSMIDNQVTLSNVQKLQYLRSAVIGDAAKVIESLDTIDQNYTHAWEVLNTTYSNKRLIVMRHSQLLLRPPPVEENSATSLRQFINHIRQHTRSLNSLKISTESSRDVLLILQYLPKLSKKTCMEFEKTLTSDDLPTIDILLDFLNE
ncbi:hypothetical protein ANTPLA_LOCUS673 [Anthophora plagiata]